MAWSQDVIVAVPSMAFDHGIALFTFLGLQGLSPLAAYGAGT